MHVPVNMYESDAAVVVVVPLPGVMPDNIDVVLSGRQLRISASMRSPAPKDYLLHEWHYGPFERTVELFDKATNPLLSRARPAQGGFGRKVGNQEFGRI